HHHQERALAAAGWPEQADELALPHGEADITDRLEVARVHLAHALDHDPRGGRRVGHRDGRLLSVSSTSASGSTSAYFMSMSKRFIWCDVSLRSATHSMGTTTR